MSNQLPGETSYDDSGVGEHDVSPKQAVEKAKKLLQNRMRDLQKITVREMHEALHKLEEVLSLCKSAKTIHHFAARIFDIDRVILSPVLEKHRMQTVGFSQRLLEQLRTVFSNISSALISNFPSRGLLARLKKVDFEEPLSRVNSIIDTNLTTIQETGEFVLVRVRSRPDGPEWTQLDIRKANDMAGVGNPSGDSDLQPHVNEVLRICPKFRILVLGRSGVGKSSLINKVFNISTAEVSDHRAGQADINAEFMSPHNPYFILHDSCGFEYGANDKLDIVKRFIDTRVKNPHVSEQLHAIWLCLSIPSGGERLLEFGEEEVLRMNLGEVPLVVVFTKYDMLISEAEEELNRESSPTDADCPVKARAQEKYRELCVQQLEDALSTSGQPARSSQHVSDRRGYDDSITQLIRITSDRINHRVQATWAIAQRRDAQLSMDASIEIGRQKYWKALSKSASFHNKSLQKCLWALHVDTVIAWNIYDPDNCLQTQSMINLLSATIAELADDEVGEDPSVALQAGISLVREVGNIAGGAGVPAGNQGGDILANVLKLLQWIYMTYERTPGILRCLMAYIIDINVLLSQLFWVIQKKGGLQPATQDIVEKIVLDFNTSVQKRRIHDAVRTFVSRMSPFFAFKRDDVLEEVVRLIENFSQFSDGSSNAYVCI